jgi:hypothetical protein
VKVQDVYEEILFRFESGDLVVQLGDPVGIIGAECGSYDRNAESNEPLRSARKIDFCSLRKGLYDVLKVFNGGRDCEKTHISGCFGDSLERILMFVQEYLVLLLDCHLGV